MEYRQPSVKDIDNYVSNEQWKLNLDKAAYEQNLGAGENVPLLKKENHRHYSHEYRPEIICEGVKWFSSQSIMFHTENNMNRTANILQYLLKLILDQFLRRSN